MNLGCLFVACTYPGCITPLPSYKHTTHAHCITHAVTLPSVNQHCLKIQLRLEIITCYEPLCFHTFSVLKETKIGHRDGFTGKGCCQERQRLEFNH